MAAAAVSCSMMSKCVLNGQAIRAQSSAASNNSGINSLVWDPLRKSQLVALRSSASSFISSFALKQNPTWGRSGQRFALARASSKGDEDTEIENEGIVKVEESEGGQKNVRAQFMTSLAKPAVVALMVAVLLAQPTEESLAAGSGGRMGGKSFSSRPSAPPSRSYSGGGGGGGRAYSGGGGGGGVYVAPPIYGSPFGFSPFGYSPFYGGGYGGGGLFYGPSLGFGGGGTILFAIFAFATVRAVVGFIRDRFNNDENGDDRFDE